MAKKIPPLTDSQCRRARYRTDGSNRLFDGGGLYLETLPSEQKRWRLKYRHPISKKENILTFGAYPDIPLVEARAQRAVAKRDVADGNDPRRAPSQDTSPSASRTFEAIAAEWLDIKKRAWSAGYYARMENALKANTYEAFGAIPIDRVSGKAVLDAVRVVEDRRAVEMASRVFEAIGMVLRYAVGIGEARADVTQGLRQFLADRPPVRHFPHVPKDSIASLLRSIDLYQGRPETRYALQLMMHTFLRTNELRWAKWTEFNFEAAVWEVPAARMKGTVMQKRWGPTHLVPLSRQSLKILRALQKISGGHEYLFPGMRNPRGVISAETINKALKIMGFEGEQTGHGFRGLASTVMNEESGARSDVIECQLAHKDRNKIRRTYNHAEYWDERCQLMQWWSDYLDEQAREVHTPIAKTHTPIHTPKQTWCDGVRVGNPCK